MEYVITKKYLMNGNELPVGHKFVEGDIPADHLKAMLAKGCAEVVDQPAPEVPVEE